MSSAELAEQLRSLTVETLEALERHHFPGWRIPRVFAGHAVGADVRADLCFTLAHLADAGVDDVAGKHPDAITARLMTEVDGPSTHTFFSYRIAETLARHGPFAGNPLLAECDAAQRDQVAVATDSSDWIELLDSGLLPRNYAAVLARCELGRERLGLVDDTAALDSLIARAAAVLGENPRRYLDDSNHRVGRYDIYTADVWLFCEPLSPRLGPVWEEGLRTALDLVLAVGSRDGTAIPWGRSTGALGAALTVELAALALAGGYADDHGPVWLRRANDATRTLEQVFDRDGVVNAHRHRDQDEYRGPARRLQLTLDLLGKVAWAAATLARAPTEAQSRRRPRRTRSTTAGSASSTIAPRECGPIAARARTSCSRSSARAAATTSPRRTSPGSGRCRWTGTCRAGHHSWCPGSGGTPPPGCPRRCATRTAC